MMMMCCSPMHYSITSETVMETLRNTTGRGHRRGGRRESIFPFSLNLTVKEYFPIWRKKVKSASTNCFHVKKCAAFF